MHRINVISAIFLFICVITLMGGCRQQSEPVTVRSLLQQMVDRSHLAKFPEPYYETGQFSSYDRRSEKRDGPGWFANLDRTHFIRTDQHRGRTEYVMMDTSGPGAITRFWMTFAGPGAGQGTLRIYLDHADQPVIEGKALDVLSGEQLTGKPLSTSVSPKTDYNKRGHNLYLPIPYRKHVKVTYQSDNIEKAGAASGGEAVYYNINYRTYENGTPVHTFSKRRLQEADSLLMAVQQKLQHMNHEASMNEYSIEQLSIDTTLEAGETYSLNLDSAGAIRELGLTISAQNRPQALRSTVIELQFDGRSTVWAPVGDFFGTGYQIRPHTTWYTDIEADGSMHAYWVMPFKASAAIKLHNFGDQHTKISGNIGTSDWNWTTHSMHFGSSWRGEYDVDTGERKSPDGSGDPFDIDYTHLEGKGVYVGDVLTLFNSAYAWWGEGDEKIYVDGENFPSHFGTGTEDYYGYAWARPADFTRHPFISQPDGSGNLEPGYTVNLRYRSLDDIPFREELEVDMEMWHWVNTTIDYAVTSHFYSRPGTKILVSPDTVSVQKTVALHRSDIVSNTLQDGKLEGEQMVLDTLTGGSIKYQNLTDPGWSGNKQLWWYNGTPGDRLKMQFKADSSGTYSVSGQFTHAHDYGTFELRINGKSAGTFDGYSDTLSTTHWELGRHTLRQGVNTLTVILKGYSPEEKKAFWGVDYLTFNKSN